MINIKEIAQCIVENLEDCGFDDILDSSGYYVIKKKEDGTDRAVDVHKSTDGGNPHYVIYCSFEENDDREGIWESTNDLSVENLIEKLNELCD